MDTTGTRVGAGLSYRLELHRDIVAHLADIDFFEIATEQLLHASPDRIASLRALAAGRPLVPHGTEMSIGSALPPSQAYLEQLGRLLRAVDAPWFSDHLGFSRVPELDIGQSAPLWLTEASLEVVRRNVHRVQEHIRVPFLLENITYYFPIPHGEMSEAEFLSRALLEADCGLLLDLNNLHINARNLGFDPYVLLSELPLDRVLQIHLSGGRPVFGMVVNNHGARVHDEVWQLLEHVVPRSPVRGIVLEWDQDFPPFCVLLEHLARARSVLRRFGAERGAAC
jgi:uncharacterized protein (UPF0276 family)